MTLMPNSISSGSVGSPSSMAARTRFLIGDDHSVRFRKPSSSASAWKMQQPNCYCISMASFRPQVYCLYSCCNHSLSLRENWSKEILTPKRRAADISCPVFSWNPSSRNSSLLINLSRLVSPASMIASNTAVVSLKFRPLLFAWFRMLSSTSVRFSWPFESTS